MSKKVESDNITLAAQKEEFDRDATETRRYMEWRPRPVSNYEDFEMMMKSNTVKTNDGNLGG